MPAVSAARRIALKKLSLLRGQMRSPLRDAIASQRERFSEIGTIRRAAVFALCAATSMNPGRRSTSDQSSRRISAERNPANAANARQGVTSAEEFFSNLASSDGVKMSVGTRLSLRFSTLQSKSTSFDSHSWRCANAKNVLNVRRKLL